MGGWPRLVVNGKTLYIQPYIDSASGDIWLLANSNASTGGNWYTGFLYDVNTGKWYTGNGDAQSYQGRTWESVYNDIMSRGWTELTDYQQLPPE